MNEKIDKKIHKIVSFYSETKIDHEKRKNTLEKVFEMLVKIEIIMIIKE